MTIWNADDVVEATGGSGQGTWQASRVCIDSRAVERGDLFVALKGERFDGHDYVKDAFSKGAVAAIVSDIPAGMKPDSRLVMVDDTMHALEALGVAARSRTRARVVGVTGSVGKTGCKEMLRCALSAVGKTYASTANLNNHIGVPLNLANMPADSDYAVIEMGMNHAGEIAHLTKFVRPDISIITTVEAVHLENFDSIEGIADAKSEIFLGMGGQGIALLNADNAYFDRCYKAAVKQGIDRIMGFGTGEHVVCRMNDYRFTESGSEVEATIAGTKLHYHLGTIGKHWGLMSVAVLGMVDALGADLPKAAAALATFSEPEGRGQIAKLKVKGGYLRLIDDAYNASPVSMKAAFEKLYELQQISQPRCRTVAVLGDMLELGPRERELHVSLVPSLVNNQIDLVFSAGTFMKDMYDTLPETMRGAYDPNALGLAPKVVAALRPRDLVLVKGSHGSKMHLVVDAISENARQLESIGAESDAV